MAQQLDPMSVRMHDIEEKLDQLAREQAHQKVLTEQLLSRVDATAAYYEQRVDLIYRRVDIALREMLGYGNIDSVSEIEADAVLARFMRTSEMQFTASEQLRIAVSGELKPGLIESPLTLHGFRINRRRARELGDGVELFGNEEGIAVYGPYKLLRPGKYRVVAKLERIQREGNQHAGRKGGALFIDVFGSDQHNIIVVGEVSPPADDHTCDLGVEFSWAGGSVEVRVSNNTGLPWKLISFVIISL